MGFLFMNESNYLIYYFLIFEFYSSFSGYGVDFYFIFYFFRHDGRIKTWAEVISQQGVLVQDNMCLR